MRPLLYRVITAVLLNCMFMLHSYAQSYGLAFYSHEVVQDKRTTLDLSLNNLTPKEALNTLDVSFELSFIPNRTIYFGYILRLISDNNQNVDLVYDNQANTKHFKIIIGDRLSGVSFNIDEKQLFESWNKLRIIVDYKNNRLSVVSGGKTLTEARVHLKPASNYKLLFGANAYKQYQSTDLPPMKLRNVSAMQNNKQVANWPLNEWQGSVAGELVNHNNGVVNNPIWVKACHRYWQMEKDFVVPGDASIAFDAVKEEIHVITPDSLVTYSDKAPQLRKTAYASGRQELVPGDQALYVNNRLFYLYLDQQAVGTFNMANNRWNKGFYIFETNNGHFNKFFSKTDSSIYAIGGYGQLVYKDSVKRYDLKTGKWQMVKTKGDTFTPRYLAGLGTNATGDTAYIIGGYGSASGQQIVNPRNIYDMMRYSVKDNSFKKLFNISVKNEDFVFANSLYINEKKHAYYGLIFPQHKFKSRLQMICGSLDKPDYHAVGDTIPFQFHDVNAFADLCYFPHSGKFMVVTLFRENNQTRVKVYSLLSPPEPLTGTNTMLASSNRIIWIITGSVAVILLGLWAFVYRRKKRVTIATQVTPPLVAAISNYLPLNHTEEDPVALNDTDQLNCNKNAIFLFGDLQLFTPEGNEITRYFTPLLKELFLLIQLYSLRNGRGISSEKLNEILWFDKSEKSARNNRSVNIAKLKTLLDKMDGCHLSKDTGFWKIETDYSKTAVDYHNYLNIVSDKDRLNKQKIIQLTHITQRGNFLSGIEYEWLDTFKSKVSNEIIDSYVQFAQSVQIDDDPEFLIKLANDIFYFDPVNEDAMIIKCKALSHIGKHSLAKNTFESFNKEYKAIYGEMFERDFHSIIE
jgi:DNA-binding SARP family transcriptional activator